MEKYMANCRLIMSCNSLTKVMAPIRSRCLSLRVPSPTDDDIRSILTLIKKEERLDKVSTQQIDKIVKSSDSNIRRAVNCLQLSK
jgi:replication factor C subunit 3/5